MNIKNSNNIAKGNKTAYTKFKGLIGHNARTHEHYENENINPERTRDNLDYTNEAEALANYDRLSQENYHLNRKDTVMFEAITISLPPELKHENGIYSEEEKEVNKIFFDACIESMCEQITPGCKRMELSEDGTSLKTTYDNLISANVHYDETTPHLHLIVAPLVRDYNRAEKYVGKEDCPYQIHEADGNQFIYKYSNKEACGKEFYQHAHERLQNDVEKALGVKVTIYDEERAKSNRHVSHEDYLNEHHEELTSIKLKQAEAQLNASQSELKDAREQLNKLELKYDRVIDDWNQEKWDTYKELGQHEGFNDKRFNELKKDRLKATAYLEGAHDYIDAADWINGYERREEHAKYDELAESLEPKYQRYNGNINYFREGDQGWEKSEYPVNEDFFHPIYQLQNKWGETILVDADGNVIEPTPKDDVKARESKTIENNMPEREERSYDDELERW